MWRTCGPRPEDCEPNFPYAGLREVAIPKAMVVTDFRYYTEKYPHKLIETRA